MKKMKKSSDKALKYLKQAELHKPNNKRRNATPVFTLENIISKGMKKKVNVSSKNKVN